MTYVGIEVLKDRHQAFNYLHDALTQGLSNCTHSVIIIMCNHRTMFSNHTHIQLHWSERPSN